MSTTKVRRVRQKKSAEEVVKIDPATETTWDAIAKRTDDIRCSDEMLDYLQSEIRACLTGRVFSILRSGNVWEGIQNGLSKDYKYRPIMAMGGEQLVFDSWYKGKQKGMILRFRPVEETAFAGTEVKGVIEYSLRDLRRKEELKDIDDERPLMSFLEALPCMQPTAVEMALNLQNYKKEVVEKVKKAEFAQCVDRHGEEWGAFA
jgi:hypothetical protein